MHSQKLVWAIVKADSLICFALLIRQNIYNYINMIFTVYLVEIWPYFLLISVTVSYIFRKML